MEDKTNYNNILVGGAIGTLLGSLVAVVMANRHEIADTVRSQGGDWIDRAKDTADTWMKRRHWSNAADSELRNDFWKGSMMGLIVGVGAALLMAPKSGQQLRGQLTKKYQHIADDIAAKTEDIMHYVNSFAHQEEDEDEEDRHHAAKRHRPSPARRAATHHAASHHHNDTHAHHAPKRAAPARQRTRR